VQFITFGILLKGKIREKVKIAVKTVLPLEK